MIQTPFGRCRRRSVVLCLGTAVAGAACLFLGCASSHPQEPSNEPLVAMFAKDRTVAQRVEDVDRAWDAVLAGEAERALTREQFKRALFGSIDPVRIRVVEKLLSDTTPEGIADTRNVLRLRLPTETNWTIVEMVSTAAAERGWTELTPSLIRSYARRVPTPKDEERPERGALLKLNPGKEIDEIVYDTFVTTPPPDPKSPTRMLQEKIRTDAWELLGRLDKDGSRRAALLARDERLTSADESKDPLLADLRAAAHDLHAVPITGAELDWVRSLRGVGTAANPVNAAWWNEASAAVAGLNADQLTGFQVKHAEPVRWASRYHPEWLREDRSALRAELAARLKGRRIFERIAEGGEFGPSVRETLEQWDASLAWGDFLAMLVIDDALKNPMVRAELFRQVSLDMADTSTEYGGSLEAVRSDASSGSSAEVPVFEARLYEPRERRGDMRFIPSDQMVTSTPRALTLYHFHCQDSHNGKYAGPGTGDLEFAASYGRNCIVFTCIEDGLLDVDYYQRNGARIDLGELKEKGNRD